MMTEAACTSRRRLARPDKGQGAGHLLVLALVLLPKGDSPLLQPCEVAATAAGERGRLGVMRMAWMDLPRPRVPSTSRRWRYTRPMWSLNERRSQSVIEPGKCG